MKRTILITGANRGLGFALAKALAAQGHQVVMTARNADKLATAASEISGDMVRVVMDVTDPASIAAARAEVEQQVGLLDVIVNNAGSVLDHHRLEPDPGNPLDTDLETLDRSLALNLVGPYSTLQAFLPLLRRDTRCDVINVSSGMGAIHGMGIGAPAYRLTKAALNALTAYLNAELADTAVHVNSVCPGWVRTDLGGPHADRSVAEGIAGMLWLINDQPDLRGHFIRDQQVIEF